MPPSTETVRAPDATVQRVLEIMNRTGCTYGEVAVCAGISPTTARFMIETLRLPSRQHAARQLHAFAERNAEAQTRVDLRFV
jgi:hypothetical protein